jgi:hypothetical protein
MRSSPSYGGRKTPVTRLYVPGPQETGPIGMGFSFNCHSGPLTSAKRLSATFSEVA